DDAKYVVGSQRAVALLGLIEEIDRREALRQCIDVADADQPVAKVIAPFLSGEGVRDERLDKVGAPLRRVLRPADVFGLEGVITVVQVELGPRDFRWSDGQREVFIRLQ